MNRAALHPQLHCKFIKNTTLEGLMRDHKIDTPHLYSASHQYMVSIKTTISQLRN